MPKIVSDEAIYQAAIITVVERGYGGATTKQIAEAANISEVTLFRKYGNKAELIKQAIAAMAARLDFETAARYTGDVTADVMRVAKLYQDTAEKNGQFFYLLLSEIPRHPELADLMDTPFNMVNHMGELMAQYQAVGVLKKEHPLHAVAGLLGPLMSTNMIRSARADSPLPPLNLSEHVTFFLNGRLQPDQQEKQ